MNSDDLLKAAPAIAKGAGPLAAAILLNATAFGADITGWLELPWGTQKPAALKALQSLRAHECTAACAAGADALVVENYRANGISYHVELVFIPKYGLGVVRMTAGDDGDAFQRTLSQLTARYCKPGLQSEYDGVSELTHTKWNWVTPHGKVALDSEDTDGTLSISYEARR